MRLSDSIALVGSGDARLSDPYDCNVYAIRTPDGPVLVDAGGGRDTETLIENVRREFGEPIGALLTHAHADHSQGGPDLQDRGIEVIAPEPSEQLLTDGTEEALGIAAAKADGVYPEDYSYVHYDPDRLLAPGDIIDVGGREFEVVRIRGHARDHVAYLTHVDGQTACFIGDAVYPDGSISLLNVPGSSLADYRTDIENLLGRDIDSLLTGHGLPKLRDGQQSIAEAATALDGMYTPSSRT
jgi:glyoxylase-like metal-dependent hydrolase (beta-lactamase superfamily II)